MRHRGKRSHPRKARDYDELAKTNAGGRGNTQQEEQYPITSTIPKSEGSSAMGEVVAPLPEGAVKRGEKKPSRRR